MTPTRKIITTVIIITAIVGCFVAFKQEGESVVAKQSTPLQSITVKGTSQTTPTVQTVQQTSEYSTQNMVTHLELSATNIIWFTNYYRVQQKLPPLVTSSKLNHSSTDKIGDMFAYQYFNHTHPGSIRGFDVFFDKENYNYIKIGENLAMGDFKTSKEVVDAWMKSFEHKRNILDMVYSNIGVSVQYGMIDRSSTSIIVEHFGKPRSDCPAVNNGLDPTITSLKSQISTLQSQIQTKEGEVTSTNSINPSDNPLINEYNALVDSYNLLTNQLAGIVKSYNQQVTSYDKCIWGK